MTKRVFGWFSRYFGAAPLAAAPLAAALFAALAPGEADAAPTATVVWESDFDTATKTGTDDNSYTIELNDNTVTDGNIVIGGSATAGVLISGMNAENVTVLFKYSGFSSASDAVFATFNGTAGGNQVDQGIYDKASRPLRGKVHSDNLGLVTVSRSLV